MVRNKKTLIKLLNYVQISISKAEYIIPNGIDIQVEITPVPFDEISKTKPGEPSAAIRERVIKARKIQEERYVDCKGVHCNAQMSERLFAEPDEQGLELLRMAMKKLNLSARAYSRYLEGSPYYCRFRRFRNSAVITHCRSSFIS